MPYLLAKKKHINSNKTAQLLQRINTYLFFLKKVKYEI